MQPLTARQRQVVELMALGLTNKEIGQELGISAHTVTNHLTGAYQTCGFGGHGAGSGRRLVALVASGALDRTDDPIAA